MKKSKFLFVTSIIGLVAATIAVLYLLKDFIGELPLRSNAVSDEEENTFSENLQEDEPAENESSETEAEDEMIAFAKEKQQKVRRGYIPLKFHEAN